MGNTTVHSDPNLPDPPGLPAQGQPLSEHFRQASSDHFRLRNFDPIRDAEQFDAPLARVHDPVRRACIAVAWLTDRSRVDEVLRSGSHLEPGFGGRRRIAAVELLPSSNGDP